MRGINGYAASLRAQGTKSDAVDLPGYHEVLSLP